MISSQDPSQQVEPYSTTLAYTAEYVLHRRTGDEEAADLRAMAERFLEALET